MYREIKNNVDMKVATCPECGCKRLLYCSGKLKCTNCDHIIGQTFNNKLKNNKRKSNFKSNIYTKKCSKCGNDFKMNSGVQKYCFNCTTFKCKNCNKIYRYSGTILNKFCSKKCFDDYRRGKPMKNKPTMTKEQRQRAINSLRVRYTGDSGAELRNKISEATKLAMQRPEVQEKIRQPRTALSLEQRINISNRLAGKMPKNIGYTNNNYSNIQRGYYDINGDTIYFRSKWEANYALFLDFLIDHNKIKKWEFEPDTFIFEKIEIGIRSYTPDFKIFNNDGSYEYHEVKGYMDSRSKTKLKRFAKYYSNEKLVLVDSEQYRELKKQIGKLCNFY